MRRLSGQGYTLVEILVVVAIMAVLAGIMVPAVQDATEASRRGRCQNNIHQIGLALLHYNEEAQTFPPSSFWAPSILPETPNNPMLFESWVIKILPHLDQQPLADLYIKLRNPIDPATGKPLPTRNDPLTSSLFLPFRSTKMPMMLCPSDTYNRQPFMGSQGSQTSSLGDNWARCNYAANAALGVMTQTTNPACGNLPMNAAFGSGAWKDNRIRGIMGANVSVGINSVEMKDGASNTVLLGEIRAGVTAIDCRGVWAMAGGCTNSLWGHGYCGNDWGPNHIQSQGDSVLGCNQIQAAFGGRAGLVKMGMPCSSEGANIRQTARSAHRGGVFLCFADGSIHWITDSIEVSANNPGIVSVWDRLMLSSDGLPLMPNAY
jgi:prepilin-type N-terminal cleavage/methylation domain-containing protein